MTGLPVPLQPHLTDLLDAAEALEVWSDMLNKRSLADIAARIKQRADRLRHDIAAELAMAESRGHAAGVERAIRELAAKGDR